ncbi:hypothetical protein Q1695_001171 [Nippostrongylus brasiliensis]|nr:hypothetical protein Q1695_001171 [Nippostrongylus brasiliensis]
MRSVLVLFLLTVTPLAIALDCRKFSFAPACRGIMLKRADVGESSQELDNLSSQLETLSWILHQAEADERNRTSGWRIEQHQRQHHQLWLPTISERTTQHATGIILPFHGCFT